MQLTYINASPRGKSGNTDKHMLPFIEGFRDNAGCRCDIHYLLNYRKRLPELAEIFWGSENVLIGFPLYVDCVPGSLKEFLEALAPGRNGASPPRLGFMTQCGFPETAHLRYVERYLVKFTRRMGCPYLGSILKAGGEGLHIQPPVFVEKAQSRLRALGKIFGEKGELDGGLLAKLAYPEHLSYDQIAGLLPYINKALWDAWLEENGALDKSFDRPYAP